MRTAVRRWQLWLIAVFLVAVAASALGEYVASTAWHRAVARWRLFTRTG
ncbi:hypothetical protein [Streptomyces sp. GKU 895]